MMTYYITLAGFILGVFGTGVAVGRIVEKIDRLERKKEDEEHNNTSKNDRRQFPNHCDRFYDLSIEGQPFIGSTFNNNILAFYNLYVKCFTSSDREGIGVVTRELGYESIQ